MDDLYKVGERLQKEDMSAMGGAPGGPGAGPGGGPPGGPGAGPGGDMDMASFAEMLGGGDIQQYLESYEQMLQEGMQPGQPMLNQVDAEGGMLVQPEPGFVVKTKNIVTGAKVFLNIVSNEHINAPHVQSMVEMEGEQGVRVPLSIGSSVEDFDKKGEPCVAYDLVANPEVVKECNSTASYRDMVVQLCFAAIAQKYKVELDLKYKLPKIKYKGNQVAYQRIKIKKDSNIQEVSGTRMAGDADGPGSGDSTNSGPKQPDFCVFYARPGAPSIDGFAEKWGAAPEDVEEAIQLDNLNGFDLPCYRVNPFHEKIRGTMRNRAQREQEEGTPDATELSKNQTRDVLSGRTCIVQVPMPELDRQVPALKQFALEISDECLRINFPMLPRSGRTAYAHLTIWWPHPFWSSQAQTAWDTASDTLTVSLPTELPIAPVGAFDPDLLDAVF